MYHFSFDIPLISYILFAGAVALSLGFIFLSVRPAWKIRNEIKRQYDVAPLNVPLPEASIIIFAGDEAEALQRLLPVLLNQNYSSPFEVIVVNEGESDATSDIVEHLRLTHDNLYLTYTPDGARQLSRKKLALMIGIKAARYPVVVHTTATADINSDNWLARMTAPFNNPDTEVVLGYAGLNHNHDIKRGKRSRLFNATADTATWLASALSCRPYRGSEMNLAYTRDIFFRNRGFHSSLNLRYGDDDIFINEIARPHNTRVVLHPESFVNRDSYNVAKTYSELRSRYNFTRRRLPRRPGLAVAIGYVMLWLSFAAAVAAAMMSWPNLTTSCFAFAIILATLLTATLLWRRVIAMLTGKKIFTSLPFLIVARPVADTIAKIKSIRNRRYNYTWTK